MLASPTIVRNHNSSGGPFRYVLVAVVVGLASLAAVGCNSCREEPTIVIRFESSDADIRPSRAPVAVVPSPSPLPLEPPLKKATNECKRAKDCVVEPVECCDCANGGRLQAVPREQAAASKTARAAHCAQVMCAMMVSADSSCVKDMRADCIGGACVLVAKKK